MLSPGDVLGNYRIVCPLGHGATGALYVAEHLLIGRRVALKVIASSMARRPAALKLFIREARAANQIAHPNIIQITDLVEGSAGTPTFLVMELLDGYSLREVLAQEQQLAPRRAAEIGARIADAMAAAHREGVVHRDLRPKNIFICVGLSPRVKVLDFGIAHLDGAFDDEGLCGTAHYISPEQASASGCDERSDIYSLGAMLYEVVAGRPVFDHHDVRDLLAAHVAEKPAPLDLESGPERALEAVIMACLAKSADERPRSMQAIADQLRDLALEWTTPSEPPPHLREVGTLDEDELSRRFEDLWSELVSPEGAPTEIIIVDHSSALPLASSAEFACEIDQRSLVAVLEDLERLQCRHAGDDRSNSDGIVVDHVEDDSADYLFFSVTTQEPPPRAPEPASGERGRAPASSDIRMSLDR